jgi:tetratricopeptide (TPR) repeat protein
MSPGHSCLSWLPFLRAYCAPTAVSAALRELLLDTVLVLPCDLGEGEREDLWNLITSFGELPVQVAVLGDDLRPGHVCIVLDPVVEDPGCPPGSIVLAVRAPATGRRRLDAAPVLRKLRGALLEAIAIHAPGSRIESIARWAECVADSPTLALRFVAAAYAAQLASPLASDAELAARGLVDILAWLLHGVDYRVAEWVLARALQATNPGRLVSTDAAILGEQAALQRALGAGLIELLPDDDDADGVLDLRRPIESLRRMEDLPVQIPWPMLMGYLKPRLHRLVYGVLDRWHKTRPRPLRLAGPLRRPDFTGRVDVIARMLALFEPAQVVRTGVLYSMQGLGKTAFAAALCEQMGEGVEAVWLSFSEGPEPAWRRVAEALGLEAGLMRDGPRTGGIPGWLSHVHARMAEREVLIVVDDAQGVPEAELGAWLPRGPGNCAVLVLSTRAERALQRDNDAISVRLRSLDAEEARALLLRKVPALGAAVASGQADRLLLRLDGHPVAIGLVSALLEKNSLEEVTAVVESGPDALRDLVRHAVVSLDPEEKAVLGALSVAAPEGSSRALIAEMLAQQDIRSVLQRLADRAVVELGARTVRLFGVVQLAIETEMDAAERQELEYVHAVASERLMAAAKDRGDEEERDVLHADGILGLARMTRRCWASDEYSVDLCHKLACVLQGYSRGGRAETLGAVIAGYEAILGSQVCISSPELWARIQINLGTAWGDLPGDERVENLRRSVVAYEAALKVCIKIDDGELSAMVQNNLGVTLTELNDNEREQHLGRAIVLFERVLQIWTKETRPEKWAGVQNNLGTVYAQLQGGDRDRNITLAIQAFELALTVQTRESAPEGWAFIQINWGSVMTDRRNGDRTDNLRRAIGAYEAALEVYVRDIHPAEWARAQRLLALALTELPTGSRKQNLRQAIVGLRSALSISQSDAFTDHHAQTQAALDEAIEALRALDDDVEGTGAT